MLVFNLFCSLTTCISLLVLTSHPLAARPTDCQSRVDSITRVKHNHIEYAITANGYYWIIRDHDLQNISSNEFQPTGLLPPSIIGQAAVTIEKECEDLSELAIIFVDYDTRKRSLDFVSYEIDDWTEREETSRWSNKTKELRSDALFKRANIDWNNRLDAMFSLVSGYVFFIQDTFYTAVETSSHCPNEEDVESFDRHPLKELNIEGRVDAVYFDEDTQTLFVYQFDKQQFYKVQLDVQHNEKGILKAKSTTSHPITEDHLLSKICVPTAKSSPEQRQHQKQIEHPFQNDDSSVLKSHADRMRIQPVIIGAVACLALNHFHVF